MRVLVADDDLLYRRLLEAALRKGGYEVITACDGAAAWTALTCDAHPPLAILDWMMPGMDGVEVCRRARETPTSAPPYIILLTAKGTREELVVGLEAGADDYVPKPFHHDELLARVRVGVRVVELQQSLAARVHDLEQALARVKQLQGLLPICAYCKKIRDDKNYWQQVETYVTHHSEATFSHGICPPCWEDHVRPQLEEVKRLDGRPLSPRAHAL